MRPGPRTVLILTAGYGEGHNSAARALLAAFREVPGVEADMLDVFAEFAPRTNDLSRRGYLEVINRSPRLWGALYGWLDRSPLVPGLMGLLSGHARLLAAHIARRRPVALCCTYPVYPWLLRQPGRFGPGPLPPLHTVVTDALTINSLWHRAPSARWYVTDEGSARSLRAAGLPSGSVEVSGFPVGLAFADRPAALQPPDHTGRRRILYMVNSGSRSAEATVRALLDRTDCELTVTAGRDEALRARLAALDGGTGRLQVLGWTDRVPELLMTHHLLVGKAGGATTQEAINALCPMIVNQVVPGQEEGNWELLRQNAAGVRAETPEEICAAVRRAFVAEATLWHSWRTQLAKLARPAAARAIARSVLAGSEIGPMSPISPMGPIGPLLPNLPIGNATATQS
jgi:processive 1,2-diacylglycerol beta-glucosyltransferase